MYDKNGKSMWKEAKEKWLSLYKNKEVEPGLSATATLSEKMNGCVKHTWILMFLR